MIMQRFMRGEIDARTTVEELKRLAPGDESQTAIFWHPDAMPKEDLQAKLAELEEAWRADRDGPAA